MALIASDTLPAQAFFRVVAPEFVSSSMAVLDRGDRTYGLNLVTIPGLSPGLYSGVLNISVCRDFECQQQLSDVPLRVPYQLTVTTPAATSFTVGGSVTGLIGTGLVLQNNGSNALTLNANQSFAFPDLRPGDAYDVRVQTAPAGHVCSVLNGVGTVDTANVSNIQISCSTQLTLGFGMKRLSFSWPAVAGASSYELWGTENGGALAKLTTMPSAQTSVAIPISVHRFPWASARYRIRACGTGCTVSNEVATAAASAQAVGYFKASNSVISDFGSVVALSADGLTMAVGAPAERSAATGINGTQNDDSAVDAGAVYIFARSGSTWVQQAYVKGSNTQSGDMFGASLDLSDDGNVLVVGAPAEDSKASGVGGDQTDNSELQSGAAYVFRRTVSSWAQEAYVKASNTELNDRFASAVALSGDGTRLAVGAYAEASNASGVNGDQTNGSMPAAGAAYVFARSAGAWSQEAYIKASNPQSIDGFGTEIALDQDGDTLVVSSPGENSAAVGVNGNQSDNSAGLVGAAYVFSRTGSTWTQQSYLKPSNTYSNGFGMAFGSAIALSADGNTLAIGATREGSSATLVDGDQFNMLAPDAGAVYVFQRAAAAWSQHAYIKASNTDAQDAFGSSLALSADGTSLVVGSPQEQSLAKGVNGTQDDDSSLSTGAAYLYVSTNNLWQFQTYIKASNTHSFYKFGAAVALSSDGSVLAVGSAGEQSNAIGIGGNQDDTSIPTGAVYLY